jgi:hypothetical protein
MMSDDMNRMNGGLAAEEMPKLEDFFEEPGGNITPGWYDAEVIEGYATGRGTQFTTSDEPSKDGKRALRFCFALAVNNSVRNLQKTFFYAPEQFEAQYLAQIKEMREQFKGQRGAWPGQGQAQNFSINLGQLSQLSKATGFDLRKHPNGGLMPNTTIGKRIKVRVSLGKTGYDEVTSYKAL